MKLERMLKWSWPNIIYDTGFSLEGIRTAAKKKRSLHRDLNFGSLRNEATEIMVCGFQSEGNIKMEGSIKSCNFARARARARVCVCVYCQCFSSPGIEAFDGLLC